MYNRKRLFGIHTTSEGNLITLGPVCHLCDPPSRNPTIFKLHFITSSLSRRKNQWAVNISGEYFENYSDRQQESKTKRSVCTVIKLQALI